LEEIGIIIPRSSFEVVGMINDDTDPVGRVHLGIALVVRIDTPNMLFGGETDILVERKWVGKDEIVERYDVYESWSKIFFDHHISRIL
jgi:predicted NUDIX family phosphoesterase